MKNYRYVNVIDRIPIVLGKQGENDVEIVRWKNLNSLYTALYGQGTFSLVVQSPEGNVYPTTVETEDNDVIWIVKDSDLITSGCGYCELTYVVNDKVAKSATYKIQIIESLIGSQPSDPPDPVKTWVDKVIKNAEDAKKSAIEASNSAEQAKEAQNEAASSSNIAKESAAAAENARNAIENMEVSAVTLPSGNNATVSKETVDDKVTLTFGIPKGEKGENGDDIFWVTTKLTEEDETEGEVSIDKTAEEIIDAYKSGKIIFWNVIVSDSSGGHEIVHKFILRQSRIMDYSNNAGIMYIVFNANSFGLDSDYSDLAGVIILDIHDNKMQANISSSYVGILTEQLPVESNLNGAAREGYGLNTYVAHYDHVHPAPFPDWTKSIGKALFVNNDNTTPSQAFEWRDVPSGTFTSKVGDVLRVAEVDNEGHPTQWKTDSLINAKGVSF